jgi:catechol 2,3-dioxygenase-like lactoylglutathione lyase family enzyme
MPRALLFLSFLISLSISFATGCAMHRDSTGLRAAVDAVLDDFHAAASEADGARYFAHFAPDGVFIGTDATERWTVDEFRAYAEPHFSKGNGWTYAVVERHVDFHPDERSAWFDERLQNEAYGETRGSGVLRWIDGAWRIEQYVLSFPIPNDVAKDVVAQIQDPRRRLLESAAVGFVKVPVSDIMKAAVFYRDVLGLNEDFVVEEYGWGQFSTGSIPICLYVTGMGGGTREPGGETGIQLRVADVRAAHAKLAAADAVEGELIVGDDGTANFLARDPDGNLIQVAQLPE